MLFSQITPRGILSFGPETKPIELGKLNVLIGPNGSGKSNLIDVISLFQAAPDDLSKPIRSTDGIVNWQHQAPSFIINISVAQVTLPYHENFLFHEIGFAEQEGKMILLDEKISRKDDLVFFQFGVSDSFILANRQKKQLLSKDLSPNHSILSQRREPDLYPEITWMSKQYERIRIYRDWSYGRNAPARFPQVTDQITSYLLEDFSNLGPVLRRMLEHEEVKTQVLEQLRRLNPYIDDILFSVKSGTLQIEIDEHGCVIPSSRISDGTLHYLCLLAILCDPDPPPLVCIEEPEMGLHPDILHVIAELLIEASERTQLIVTTHSDVLVSALSDVPESVVVCEATEEGTSMRRLDPDRLSHWLKDYSLGDLWTSGELGGNRW